MDDPFRDQGIKQFMNNALTEGLATGKPVKQIATEVSSALRDQFQKLLEFAPRRLSTEGVNKSPSDRPQAEPEGRKTNDPPPKPARYKPSKVKNYSTRLITNKERDFFYSLKEPLTAKQKALINSQNALYDCEEFRMLRNCWEKANVVVKVGFLRWLGIEWGIHTEADIDIFERRHD